MGLKMKKVNAAFVGAVILFGAGAAQASTCTAPGHPTCTITCPAGCAALYYEPNGPCKTICSGSAAANKSAPAISSDVQGVSNSELKKLLNKK
jgi:hypothetical protein